MTCAANKAKPGYPAFRPPSYQVLGPEQDQRLDLILLTMPGGAFDGASAGVIQFWVNTPFVRCRTRVALVLEPDAPSDTANPQEDPNTVILDGNAFLWVAENERSRGGTAQKSPVRNLVGTAAAPLAIPTDARLWGYVAELETNGRQLYGRFTAPSSATDSPAAKWHLCVRYESIFPCSDEEWNQFMQGQLIRCNPEGGAVLV